MIDKKTWSEFRETGLVLFINSILHVFGWSLVFEIDSDTKEITNVYPARVKFRGFDENSASESYRQITDYLKANIDQLKTETDE